MATYEPNPPWVDKALTTDWTDIEKRFGQELSPIPIKKSGVRRKVTTHEEYGSGHYGTVLPTPTPGIVFKVTSDPSEAAFVAAAMQMGEWPEGIVRYLGVFRTHTEYKRRPVFVLAREEAQDVGDFIKWMMSKDGPDIQTKRLALRRFGQFQQWADVVRDKIVKSESRRRTIEAIVGLSDWAEDRVEWDAILDTDLSHYSMSPEKMINLQGTRLAAYALRACKIIAESMTNEDVGYLIGGAFEFYLDRGLLLADVHLGNIGRVHREDYSKPVWVITDPGHMVPVDTRWLDIEVPEL